MCELRRPATEAEDLGQQIPATLREAERLIALYFSGPQDAGEYDRQLFNLRVQLGQLNERLGLS